jgi:hypothetical protein
VDRLIEPDHREPQQSFGALPTFGRRHLCTVVQISQSVVVLPTGNWSILLETAMKDGKAVSGESKKEICISKIGDECIKPSTGPATIR